jgi:hypothetical protein
MSREKKVFFCALATVSLLLPPSLFTLARPISLPCPTLLTSTTLFYKPPSNEKKSQTRTKKQFVGLATEVGLSSVADALPAVIDRFSPLSTIKKEEKQEGKRRRAAFPPLAAWQLLSKQNPRRRFPSSSFFFSDLLP